jgi:hypothetical protein
MEFFTFILPENSISNPEAEIVEHEIKVFLPLKPDTFSQVMKHLMADDLMLAGQLIIEQHMWLEGEDKDKKKKLYDKILSDGRLLYSCAALLAPVFRLCTGSVKKN